MVATSEETKVRSKLRNRGVGGMALTEFWERFSFYGLQSILTFYLIYRLDEGGLGMNPIAASGIVGAYGGAVYLSQLLGAWVGERLVSPRNMVLYGGIIIAIGHLALAFVPSFLGLGIGLMLIVLGTGALKTNITSLVGFILDGEPEAKRDAGFSYFYIALNCGAAFGPLTTGFAQNQWGFHFGFGLAAIGMFVSLVQFVRSSKDLPSRAHEVLKPLPAGTLSKYIYLAGASIVLIAVATISGLLKAERLATIVTALTLFAAATYFIVILRSKRVTTGEKKRVLSFIPLFIVSGLFFGFLFQKFTATSLLINERVDLTFGSWTFPVGWITMISSLAGVAMFPVAASMWKKLGDRQPKPATKFAIGIFQVGIGFFFILFASSAFEGQMIPFVFIVLYMCIMGSSEAFVGPIGLSLATRIGPKEFQGQMVALNFLTLALGSSLSGLLGQLFSVVSSDSYFVIVGSIAIGVGVLLFFTRGAINRNIYADLHSK